MESNKTATLTSRWSQMRYHKEQHRYMNSPVRFNCVHSGRRGGKTEKAKRKVVLKALGSTADWNPRFFIAAPTYGQVKRIYWQDMKELIPSRFIHSKSESELVIRLINGAEIHLFGMDKPERVEGSPWDGGILDEFANMKPQTWNTHVRPALADRSGWCDLIGVPEGRNHYYEMVQDAKLKANWDVFHWPSADILPAEEIAEAMNDMDQLTFDQEYGGQFVSFQGQAYHNFDRDIHAAHPLKYNDEGEIVLNFDFNVQPGTATIAQEQELPSGEVGTGYIGEVYIPTNSTTEAVCNKIVKDWGNHKGYVTFLNNIS